MKSHPNGAGTLLSGPEQVNSKEAAPVDRQSKPRLPRPDARPKRPARGEKMTLRFVNEDGSHWRSEQIDRRLIENARPFAAAAGRTIEQYIVDCLEMAADDRPSTAKPAELARPEPVRAATAPLAIQLDAEASRLVRWVHAGDPAYTLADVVNGAVRFNHGEEGVEACEGRKCLDAARVARLASEQKGGA